MIPTDTEDELTRLRRRIEELETSEARYRGIFESIPISLWEEDWSAVKQHIDRLVASGVTDLDAHLQSNRGDLVTCMRLVKILDVNKATLDLCGASSKEQVLAGLSGTFDEATLGTFRREIVALHGGATFYEEETTATTLDRAPRAVMFRIAIGAGAGRTWGQCIVSLVDITDRKRAEEALAQSKEETIRAQKTMLAKLSTPVIPISPEVIVMPLIGALDQARMDQATGTLLDELQRSGARIAILDITGVPGMDAEATHGILQAARAVRLLGAQVVLTGIRPEVARSLLDFGSDLPDLVTRSTLQAGIAYAIRDRSPSR
ncbi:STAS domain-containing protein [Polyangium aurulentum]|uniref:STAS domain-containing protein n=1 Tax=Polyangium aurulentum TaxID=2567896 RepID=UPI0010ADAD64|nr:STAS domain-containing protein [Polyangium aurulentum]UQA56876.1 STAS domain-containing protein [Polyangium aurulentum]